jgi:hypothetical protein
LDSTGVYTEIDPNKELTPMKRIPLADHAKSPATERIASSFKRLAVTSTELTTAAGELGQAFSSFEKALQKLDLVPAWHKVAGAEDGYGSYWTRDIGYTTVRGEWAIALRRRERRS